MDISHLNNTRMNGNGRNDVSANFLCLMDNPFTNGESLVINSNQKCHTQNTMGENDGSFYFLFF